MQWHTHTQTSPESSLFVKHMPPYKAPWHPQTCDLRGVLQNTQTPQARQYEIKYEKNYQIPHSGLGPKNTEKKQKNTKMAIFWQFS